MFKNSDELLKFISDEGVKFVDVRFSDLPGVMQHFTLPAKAFDADAIEEGLAFDGSSVRGFQSIHESDMLLLPDLYTARLDPFRIEKTLIVNFFVHDPFTREAYSRDPRNIARKAEQYITDSGIADTAYFGAEAEFYIFDSVQFDTTANASFHKIDAVSGWWNTGREEEGGNLGYKVKYKGGYFPVTPNDHYADLRDQMVLNMEAQGFTVERAHHEVGTGGQAEINYKFNTLLHAADDLMLFKYIIKNTAWQAGKSVTFMPKPLFGDNGSGMHTHQSLWKDGAPLFHDERLRGPVRHRPPLHRRHPAPRAVAAGLHQPDGELLPPPGPRLRGPGQPGLLPAQPLGVRPHPDHGQQPEGQAHRVPLPRLLGQPVPRLLGDGHGGPRRREEQDRAAGPDRQGPLRAPARGGPRRQAGPRDPGRRARQPGGRPRVPARGRRVHPGRDRHLDLVQA